MIWEEVILETLYAEPSRNGVYKSKEHHGDGAKIVNMGELFGHDFIGKQEMKRLRMSDSELNTHGLAEGDILFGRRSLVEAGAGKCSIVEALDEPTTFESSIIRVRLNTTEIDPRFLFYWLRSPVGRGRVSSIVTGTNVKGIRGSDLKRLAVPKPDLSTQMTIVEKVRPYDDLIANNKRRIELLEQLARLLFKEWFVHLRYPGHEHDKIVEGLPEGWERTTLGRSAQFFSGGTPSKARADFWEGNIPWVSSGELTQMRISDTSLHLTEEAVNEGSRFVPADTILAVVRGMSLAKEFRVGMAARELSFNQDIKALIANDGVDPLFLYHAIEIQRDRIRDQATDASHGTKKLETPVLSGVPILFPEKSLMQSFREQVSPLHRQWDVLAQQNTSLVRARDLLLPRLMDGRISV